jgi:peptide deformylase
VAEVEQQHEEELVDPEREVRRAYAFAQVRQYPDAVLRMRAREVDSFGEGAEKLARRMTQLMHDANGVGLAAPQLGILQRVVVYQTETHEQPVVLVNPVLVSRSDDVEVAEEGCLSLDRAGVTVDVERSVAVRVEAVTPEGDPLSIEAEGLEARVIQHELDHLDGVLIIDRTRPEQRKAALARLRPRPELGPF